ncbi:TPA: N,N'-diacetylchitobiose phosphorylase [Streptococcus suis]|nr:N,N'-diacetylchitobiose phosphorylase [Streptococcus suis]
MQYGYFDDEKKEYIITNPATPAPWVNYLGSPEYGAIISNNAGGYSFATSGANGRILRYIFNHMGQPGRYIYIRDNDSKDYWSASWQPVGKDLHDYSIQCHHGLGYTTMNAKYSSIATSTTYYVPKDQTYEVWAITLTNHSNQTRNLTVSGYAEFTNHGNYEQDQVNLQYSLFISRTKFATNKIVQQLHGNLDSLKDEDQVDEKNVTERFFGLAGAQISSYCGDKQEFLGSYNGYHNPQGILSGHLGNILNTSENACGALSSQVILKPGQSKTIAFILGEKTQEEADRILHQFTNTEKEIKDDLLALKELWNSRLANLQVQTPSSEFNSMLNIWNAYNCYMTFIWSRAASYIYCGLRNGYGYRDTVQDIQGIIHLHPEMAVDKIRFMLSAQVNNGAGLPLVKFTHNAGHEDTPDDPSYVQETGHPAYRADDALWLFPTIYKYITETGNIDFLDEVIPYANHGKATVYQHLQAAIDFSINHLGPHGLPAGLHADWNDCLRLGANGESSFVALQFYYALSIIKEFAVEKNDTAYLKQIEQLQEEYYSKIQHLCWDRDRFIRGFTENGEKIGTPEANEANLWLNPQSWSVISGLATPDQAKLAMNQVFNRLNTQFGAILMDPPYHKEAFDGALAVIYNQGTKENAGIFSQSQGWLILAEALLGNGNRAFNYYLENSPAAQNTIAEIRKLEPYCFGQFTEGKDSPHFGRSHVHWLTGTASTMMVASVEGILGIRPTLDGIRLSPAIPKEWPEVQITKQFRGKTLYITISNPNHKETGCSSLILNGVEIDGNYIDQSLLKEENSILLTL